MKYDKALGKLKPLIFHLSKMENQWFVGVPIFKHIRLLSDVCLLVHKAMFVLKFCL